MVMAWMGDGIRFQDNGKLTSLRNCQSGSRIICQVSITTGSDARPLIFNKHLYLSHTSNTNQSSANFPDYLSLGMPDVRLSMCPTFYY